MRAAASPAWNGSGDVQRQQVRYQVRRGEREAEPGPGFRPEQRLRTTFVAAGKACQCRCQAGHPGKQRGEMPIVTHAEDRLRRRVAELARELRSSAKRRRLTRCIDRRAVSRLRRGCSRRSHARSAGCWRDRPAGTQRSSASVIRHLRASPAAWRDRRSRKPRRRACGRPRPPGSRAAAQHDGRGELRGGEVCRRARARGRGNRPGSLKCARRHHQASSCQAKPSRPSKEGAAAGPQLPAV